MRNTKGAIFLLVVLSLASGFFIPEAGSLYRYIFFWFIKAVIATLIAVWLMRRVRQVNPLQAIGFLIISMLLVLLGDFARDIFIRGPVREEARKRMSQQVEIISTKSLRNFLDLYYIDYNSYPTVQEGGLGALVPSYLEEIPFRDKIIYAYCVNPKGKASAYHIGLIIENTLLGAETEDANFDSSAEESQQFCEGTWHFEDGTPGGFNGKEYFDIACRDLGICIPSS